MNAPLILSPELVRQAAVEAADPQSIVLLALDKLANDAGAMYEIEVLDALKAIRRKSEADYSRLVAPAKGCRTRLDKLTKPEGGANAQDGYLDLILSEAKESCTFAHTIDGQGVALIDVDSHREVHLLNAPGFDRWLRGKVYARHKIGIPEQAMRTALATLTAICTFDGNQIEVHIRCAKHGDDYYIDLCDERWRVIRISASGVVVLERSPVHFIRKPGMLPLPVPTDEPDIQLLWNHINVTKDAQLLLLSWLLDSMRPDTPYPELELCGEMGAAKSTTHRRLRALVDPHEVPLRSRPKTVEDIHIAAANAYVCCFENLSSLSADQQDALCILSTGGGYATRKLYTNGAEHVIQSKRPVIVNGINPVATQPDLIERVISVELPAIAAERRQDEQALESVWVADYPNIFTGLVALFSEALALLPEVQIPEGLQKRMLDFQKIGEAACMALGGKSGDFSRRLDDLHNDSVIRGLESYGITTGIQLLTDRWLKGKPWQGTYLDLLTNLNGLPEVERSNWPKSARHLSSQLKRIAPGLRRLGINIEKLGHSRSGARVQINRI